MTTTPMNPIVVEAHEGTLWLRAQGGARVAELKRRGYLDNIEHDVVVASLGEPARTGSPEDRSCDRCAHYAPEGEAFFVFQYAARRNVVLFGGLCAPCARKEFGDDTVLEAVNRA